MSLHEDYKNLIEMDKEMDSHLNMLNELNDKSITEVYGLNLMIKDVLSKYTKEDVDKFTEEEINDILEKAFSGYGENENIKNMKENHQGSEEYRDKPYSEFAKFVFKDIVDSNETIKDMKEKKEQIGEELKNFSNDYFNYVNSPEYKERKQKRIQELREKAKSEENPSVKSDIEHMLHVLEKSEDLSFLMDHIEERGPKEIDNIANVFFDKERSSIVMKKFASRIGKFGYNPGVYKHFFNIEEMFLPEEYHKFNNLFLFHVMRTISFMDAYNKDDNLYVSSILVKIYNLIYHKYPTKEQENEFIDYIKAFDDRFVEKWSNEFVEKNVTDPNHPERIKKEAEIDQKNRLMLIAHLQNRGVDPDTSLSTTELRHMLDEVLEKEQKEEEKKEPVQKEEYKSSDVTPLTPSEVVDEPEEIDEEDTEEDEDDDGEIFVEIEGEDAELNEEVFITPTLSKDEQREAFQNSIDHKKELDNEMNAQARAEIAEEKKEFLENVKDETPTLVQKDVYVDRYGYYYIQDEESDTYTYYTRENTIHESGVPELTVLQLMNAGVLTKETRYV